jgi:hypothetical protein
MTDQEKLDRLHRWLEARGWQDMQIDSPEFEAWQPPNGADLSTWPLVPRRPETPSFEGALCYAVRVIAALSEMDDWQLWAELYGWTAPEVKE